MRQIRASPPACACSEILERPAVTPRLNIPDRLCDALLACRRKPPWWWTARKKGGGTKCRVSRSRQLAPCGLQAERAAPAACSGCGSPMGPRVRRTGCALALLAAASSAAAAPRRLQPDDLEARWQKLPEEQRATSSWTYTTAHALRKMGGTGRADKSLVIHSLGAAMEREGAFSDDPDAMPCAPAAFCLVAPLLLLTVLLLQHEDLLGALPAAAGVQPDHGRAHRTAHARLAARQGGQPHRPR